MRNWLSLATSPKHCAVKAPQCALVVKPLDENTIENALAQGHIDLAICEDQQTPAHLPKRKLLSDAYVCVASKQANNTAVRSQPEHLVLTRTHSRLDRLVSQWETTLGLDRYTTLSVPSYSLAPDFIDAYNAMALMPSRLTSKHRVDIIPTEQQPPNFDIVATWHTRATQDPLHRWLIDCLAEVCADKRHALPETA